MKNLFKGRLMRNIFAVFEGLDGSGKTTRLLEVSKVLKLNYQVEVTKEPQPTEFAKKMIIGEDTFEFSYKDREYHQDYLIQSRLNNDFLLCDRYAMSGSVYHAFNKKTALERYKLQLNDFLNPDITIFIDTKIELCKERLRLRSKTEEEYLKEIHKMEEFSEYYNYILQDSKNIIIINGDSVEEDVSKILFNLI